MGFQKVQGFPCHLCSQVASLLPECSRLLGERVSPGLAIQMCCFRKIIKCSSNTDLRWLRRELGFLCFQCLPDVLVWLAGGKVVMYVSKINFSLTLQILPIFPPLWAMLLCSQLNDETSTRFIFLRQLKFNFPAQKEAVGVIFAVQAADRFHFPPKIIF